MEEFLKSENGINLPHEENCIPEISGGGKSSRNATSQIGNSIVEVDRI